MTPFLRDEYIPIFPRTVTILDSFPRIRLVELVL